MQVILKKIPTYTDLEYEYEFVDKESKKSAGKIEFSINPLNKVAILDYIYLHPEYRKVGILSDNIDNILCKMKCAGADTVELKAITEEIAGMWEKFKFTKISEKRIAGGVEINMKRGLKQKCLCCDK